MQRRVNLAIGAFAMRGIGQCIVLPEPEVAKIRKAAFAQWDALGAKSPRMKALVQAMRRFVADKGISTD